MPFAICNLFRRLDNTGHRKLNKTAGMKQLFNCKCSRMHTQISSSLAQNNSHRSKMGAEGQRRGVATTAWQTK